MASNVLPGHGPTLGDKLLAALKGKVLVNPQLRALIGRATAPGASREQKEQLVDELVQAVWLFSTRDPLAILQEIDAALAGAFEVYPRDRTVSIVAEPSVAQARIETNSVGLKLGFGPLERTRAATAASELTRNILMYAGQGELKIRVRARAKLGLELEASDRGPGIPNVEEILSGEYRSKSGLGLGLRGVKAIAQDFRVQSSPGEGTRVFALFESSQRRPPAPPK